ncbi:acetolactate synthase I/II/III large subunit [Microdochium trichocladiopsis]|uniref:Acetolactate synthase I/II/III large subunit n=1 Tax=Microdochium trichocladiopsis TaxID=1682393 RepID=A0A9P8XWI2_9PEZI|nr:acetolactate synthase I/II/III large subunit [Microdochium trichocladiopsis]KAH7021483.1 acetolactate synthase I/II/III large subunit [Microdochium trichocladiopsis]
MPPFELKHPKGRELVGGDLVAQTLAHLGVTVAFGLHGGHLDSFLTGCAFVGIKLVDTRHETAAVQAAEGYAKVSGKTGLAFVTANSGFANGYPGLATALADRSPIFVVTSSPPLRDAETNALQGFHDQVVLARPVTKFAHRATVVEELPRLVSHAWRIASAGAPGPVLIDFPVDILFTPPRFNAISWGSLDRQISSRPGPAPASVDELARLWKAAKRPVFITGTGAADTGRIGASQPILLQLAEATQTPIFWSSKFSLAIPHNHPLRGGPATGLAYLPYIQQERPDLLILLGARTGFLLGGRNGAIIPHKDCTLVQVDVDGGEIGRTLPVDLGIVSDVSEFVNTMAKKVALDAAFTTSRDRDWIKMTSSLKGLIHRRYGSDPKQGCPDDTGDRMHPYHGIKAVFEVVADHEPIVIGDGGECGVWAGDLIECAKPAHFLAATGYLGFLGNGWGYSLGAAVAHPDKLIVNVQGDGSAGFHIAELDTYARHRLKILTVVVNNYRWGMSIAGQDILYGESTPGRLLSSLSPVCRFDKVAEGFGGLGVRIDKADEVQAAVKQIVEDMAANNDFTPGLVNLIVDTDPVTETTKSMVGMPAPGREKEVVVVPYYDNIPRARYD